MSTWKVETRRHESGHAVHLIVGVQSFALPCGDGSYDEATWWAAQLRHAIESIERGVLEEVRDSRCGSCSAGKGVSPDGNIHDNGRFCNAAYFHDLITSRLPSCSGCESGSEGTLTESDHARRNAMVARGLDMGKTDCSGCTDPRSEGTHQMGTRQHP